MTEVKLPFDIVYNDKVQEEVLTIVVTSQGIEKDEHFITTVSSSLCEKYDLSTIVISNIENKSVGKLKETLYNINGIKVIEQN